MIMIAYNEAMDDELMQILEDSAVKNYTKVTGACGRGASSGTHLGSDIWPGRNNLLYVACDDAQSRLMLSRVRSLRAQFRREGIKAFVLPVEEIT